MRTDAFTENGCKKCAINAMTTDEFIDKAKEIHGDKYDYSLVNYIGIDYTVNIICKKHGEFIQIAYHHLKGSGCPICKESKGERLVAKILDFYNIKYIRQKSFSDLKDKRLLYFDFYLPEYNYCIEYDGEQHYKVSRFFKDKEEAYKLLIDNQRRDKIKNEYCISNNIPLLRLTYKDSDADVKSKIIDFLGIKESFIVKFTDYI